MKISKYKRIPMVLAGLVGIGLLSTGFSTWVISAQATETVSGITAEVGSVSDARLKMLIESKSDVSDATDYAESAKTYGGNKFILDAASNDTTTGSIQAKDGKEDLSFGFVAKIGLNNRYSPTGGEPFNTKQTGDQSVTSMFSKYSMTLSFATGNDSTKQSNFVTEVSKKAQDGEQFQFPFTYNSTERGFTAITFNKGNPTTTKSDFTNGGTAYSKNTTVTTDTYPYEVIESYNADNNYITLTVKFNLAWGKWWDYLNPTNFSETSSKTLETAVTNLNNLNNFSSIGFTLTLSTLES